MSRPVRVATCRDCGAKTLNGYDADICGLPRTLDHTPIDELGEAIAVLTGRITYELRAVTGRGHGREMEERNANLIRRGSRNPIHPEHQCGQPLPAATPKPVTVTDEVPF